MTRLTFEPRGIPRAIAASVERDSVRGECATSTCLRWARKVDGRGAWQLSNLTRPRQVDVPPSPVSNHAPPNNDDKTTPPLPLPPLANSCMPPPRVGMGAGALAGGGLGWDPECSEWSPLADVRGRTPGYADSLRLRLQLSLN